MRSRLGRDCVASVRQGTRDEPGKVFGPFKLRPPTDATQWRPYPMQLSRDAVPTLPQPIKRSLQLGIGERAVPKQEAGDLTVEGLLAGMLDRVAFLSDG